MTPDLNELRRRQEERAERHHKYLDDDCHQSESDLRSLIDYTRRLEKAARRVLRNLPAYGLGPPTDDGRGYIKHHARAVANLRDVLP